MRLDISNAQLTGQRDPDTVYWELLLHTCTLLVFSDLGSIDRHWLDRSSVEWKWTIIAEVRLGNKNDYWQENNCRL